jgi:hypothetical protein
VLLVIEFRQKRLIECGDSTKTDGKLMDDENTPCSKVIGKRHVDSVGSTVVELEVGKGSTNKLLKVLCIKIEKD